MDSLRFGAITSANGEAPEAIARNRRLVDGVVRGIAFYGNCFGVPTVGGEVEFEPGYAGNPLVNVLALGIAPKNQLFFARARGEGNPVIYVGAKTGRDGIHGASLLAYHGIHREWRRKTSPTSKWAILFSRSSCSRPASRRWPPERSSEFKTWAQPGSPVPPARWLREAAWELKSAGPEHLAREAQRRNIPYILATPANASIERIAEIAPDVFWFQLYRFAANDHAITFDLLRRADVAGAHVLVPTIDSAGKSKRPRDIRSGVTVPFKIRPMTVFQVATSPFWALALYKTGMLRSENVVPYTAGRATRDSTAKVIMQVRSQRQSHLG